QDFLALDRALVFPRTRSPQVSIILVFYNKAPLSLLCLQSIKAFTDTPYEVVIIDNASSDETEELLNRLENVTIERNSENLGFVKAVNMAARLSKGQYLLLLNNDAVLEDATISNAVAAIKDKPDVGAVGAKIKLLDGSLQEAGSIIWSDGSCLGYGRGEDPEAPQYMFRREVDYCSGAFLLIRSSEFSALGGFDEEFAPAYYEESDFCIRLQKKGLKIIYEPSARISHYEFASSDGFEDAARLQSAHRKLLRSKHGDFLRQKHSNLASNVLAARNVNGYPNILMIDFRVPHANLGAGFPRSAEILQEFSKMKVNLCFYALRIFDENWHQTYTTLPRNVEVFPNQGRDGLIEFLRSRRGYFEHIIISRPENMEFFSKIISRSPELVEGCRITYDAEAVIATREIMRLELKGNHLTDAKKKQMFDQELEFARSASVIITVTVKESELFRDAGLSNTLVLGHKMDASPTTRSFDERRDILFVGALREDPSPNVDSIIWFANEVLPELDLSITVIVAGDNTAPRLKYFANESIQFLGRVDDLQSLYDRCRIFIAPTRFAAGLPRKVHEAAAYGIPTVATSLLADQLGWQDGNELLVADSPHEFAAQCKRLYEDNELWHHIRNNGLKAVIRDCSTEVFQTRLYELIS
ncbi:MAG: glycosyltransferase, partial [Gammaproteobacteria bacterium]|nr:glycosyltransferase [Gammaproteobacteria bacterium]